MSTTPFPTDLPSILARMEGVSPKTYAKTRNFIDGDVTRLSPYISRGVISTADVLKSVLARGFQPKGIEKFIQELAWRDHWQNNWVAKGEEIDKDLKRPQEDVDNHEMPNALMTASTGVTAVDEAIVSLYETGYMHNHVRMYTAAIACNMAKSHWRVPARWMYYHLIDGDWASNALSWQWVGGSNAGKKYVADQRNVNKYCHTTDRGTFMDVPYEAFAEFTIPEVLSETLMPELRTPLPESRPLSIDMEQDTAVYTYYNLDPKWLADRQMNRVLILEPSHFERYPVSQRCIDFALALGQNISGLQVFVGEYAELKSALGGSKTHYKEHPTNGHFEGEEHARDWMFSRKGYHGSFFGFWKKAEKELRHMTELPFDD